MHISVLFDEVIAGLNVKPDGQYIDATLGYGGHTQGILEASSPNGTVLAFDRDATAIALATQRLGEASQRTTFVNQSFANMAQLAEKNNFTAVDGIVFDLGLSSMQLDSEERGFSFRFDAPLDMRFNPTKGETAADLINNWNEADLRDIFWRYGEEKHGRKIAKAVVENRPITTTFELAELVAKVAPRRGRIHPATKVFQALRIAVNDELGALETGLPAAIELLRPGGRIAVISFHSLEDRFVKQLFRKLSTECICPPRQPICTCDQQPTLRLLKRKAIKATEEEITTNPRSRSARLRIAEKV